jgi:hypothetical protein
MDQKAADQGNLYRIRLRETLDRSTIDWFGKVTITPQERGETLLTSWFADQSALRGFMDRLWNLNLTILYLERIEEKPPEESDTT